ncbi:methylthioribulose 1-phosphate dehydratase [Phormidium tenue]|uniref:Methylthioribulose-1-phosphate dehydratase n=1 Tax=Phormidium tenue NIES-30 TaxID=549789 RepID=A0A1U7J2E5_9CYAN|nr:methylthioribulose 1-phosphate dehydratase [Phormidium tenue]MBD2231731.1 methylthioribulose 1-phosphate dehydratase [Phormidium tenue FACHB-1052]OKH46307.1 methylthioribulose-1-phosphate dehydratase [Phormidium tenue NIES-30]
MEFEAIAQSLAEAGGFLASQGWAPATSGNYSARLAEEQVAITVSGRDKGQLTPADIMVVDSQGQPFSPGKRASAETLLHTSLYLAYPEVGAVLHTHSIDCVSLSRWLLSRGQDSLVLTNYELLKALPGITTHDGEVAIPIVANSQDMVALSKTVLTRLQAVQAPVGYIIAGHGLYSWGATVPQARMATEALEVLVSCALQAILLDQRFA